MECLEYKLIVTYDDDNDKVVAFDSIEPMSVRELGILIRAMRGYIKDNCTKE